MCSEQWLFRNKNKELKLQEYDSVLVLHFTKNCVISRIKWCFENKVIIVVILKGKITRSRKLHNVVWVKCVDCDSIL